MPDQPSKILVIDDAPNYRKALTVNLQDAGYQTIEAADGLEGLRRFYDERPDLVVLDVTMPKMHGWQVLERMREVSSVPVIMLTSIGGDKDKVRGLNSGADDYVTKPYSTEELLDRVGAVLRRTQIAPATQEMGYYQDGEMSVDYPSHTVKVRSKQIELSPTEFRLLKALTTNAGVVLSAEQLLDQARGNGYSESPHVVRLCISQLRKKIEANPKSPKLIQTVRSFGYRYHKPGS